MNTANMHTLGLYSCSLTFQTIWSFLYLAILTTFCAFSCPWIAFRICTPRRTCLLTFWSILSTWASYKIVECQPTYLSCHKLNRLSFPCFKKILAGYSNRNTIVSIWWIKIFHNMAVICYTCITRDAFHVKWIRDHQTKQTRQTKHVVS